MDEAKRYGRSDILLTPAEMKDSKTPSTPFAIIEVGCNDSDWWKKLDQSIKYVSNMGSHQRDTRLRFEKPLLLVVLTIDREGGDDGANGKLEVRLGVFLCAPRSTNIDDYRMPLLWHSRTNDVTDASKHFGRLLRATSDFSRWRDEVQSNVTWTYLGPNCCKVEVEQQVCGSVVVFCVHSLSNVLTRFTSLMTFAGRTANNNEGTSEL
jgi:hypothetical protein